MRALIVIDAQNDFAHPDGILTTPEAQAAVPEVKKLVNAFLAAGDNIYCTKDTHDENYLHTQEGQKLPVEHCRQGSWGWEFVKECGITEEEVYVLPKETFGFDKWNYEPFNMYDEIYICGFVSSICVVTNALLIKTFFPEVPIKFIAYASAGLTPENHKAAIEIMRSCQIEVIE